MEPMPCSAPYAVMLAMQATCGGLRLGRLLAAALLALKGSE
jgi:hypothetical protein